MDGAYECQYVRWEDGRLRAIDSAVIEERLVRIHVNGQELVTLACTPIDLAGLALGFLRSEGIIRGLEDVRLVVECPSKTCLDVWLRSAEFTAPSRVVLTSGCGGGVTFDDLSAQAEPLESDRQVTPQQIGAGMRQLLAAARLYAVTRGVHASALSDGQSLVAVAEDVGRHNTIDKLWGDCLRRGIDPSDHLLFATGRISSEMLNKAVKMKVPVVASHTSPTSISVALAKHWNIALFGYVRSNGFNLYAGDWRLLQSPKHIVS